MLENQTEETAPGPAAAQFPYAEVELELLGMRVGAVMWIPKEENRAELWIPEEEAACRNWY